MASCAFRSHTTPSLKELPPGQVLVQLQSTQLLTVWRGCWNTLSFSNYEMCGAGFSSCILTKATYGDTSDAEHIWESSRLLWRQKLKWSANTKKQTISFAFCFGFGTNRIVLSEAFRNRAIFHKMLILLTWYGFTIFKKNEFINNCS